MNTKYNLEELSNDYELSETITIDQLVEFWIEYRGRNYDYNVAYNSGVIRGYEMKKKETERIITAFNKIVDIVNCTDKVIDDE